MKPSKILMCSQAPLKRELGGSKPLLELAEVMPGLGWECKLVCPDDLCQPDEDPALARILYAAHLRRYLHEHAHEYDVVDYDHEYLPFPRSEFSGQTLFVARSVLLVHHLETIPIPNGRQLKSKLGALLKGRARRQAQLRRVQNAQATVQQADLVNVTNTDDKAELIRRGIDADRIAVLSFGISETRRHLFDAISSAVPTQPVIAFVGTFDYRKGAAEFPHLVEQVVSAVPNARFRLLGTSGMFPTREAVLAHFPNKLISRIDVIPRYKPEELPSLLADCSLGVFPSYMEGFPFGILEMLAASIPVIAYHAPGPPMMLDPEYLVLRGDVQAMSAKVAALLSDSLRLKEARIQARQRSQAFTWQRIAQQTSDIYSEHLRGRERSASTARNVLTVFQKW